MNGTCSTHGRDEERIQNVSLEISKEETAQKSYALMGG
jgi:hypothetical protein